MLPASEVIEMARVAAEESRGAPKINLGDLDPAVSDEPVDADASEAGGDDSSAQMAPAARAWGTSTAAAPDGTGTIVAGVASTVDAGSVQATFSGLDLADDVDVAVGPVTDTKMRRASGDGLPADAVILAAPFEVDATGPGGEVRSFPTSFDVVEYADGPDMIENVVPGVVLEVDVDPKALEGLDAGSVRILTRETSADTWVEVASYLDPSGAVVHGELDHLSQFVVIGTPFVPAAGPRVVLDPDNDIANTDGPAGPVTELPFNAALATETANRLAAYCRADVLITRGATPAVVSQATRAGMAAAFEPDLTMTLAFDALRGHPWGTEGTGGSKVYSRGGWGDDTVAASLNEQLPFYTGRPSALHGPGRIPYDDFAGVPGAMVHLEALYLDHNFDWEVIANGFGSLSDGVFTGAGMYLENVGFDCTDPATGGWPARPSAAELARWRHLGHQNYLAFGADPVSFSTGNLVEDFPLVSLPGVGEQVIDLGLTYNSQDGRPSRTGAGWSFSLGSRAQRFDDGSVLVARSDGASFVFDPDGAGGYVTDPGAGSTLAEDGHGGLVWTDADGGVWTFDASDIEGIGELTSYTNPSGQVLALTYGAPDGDDQYLPLTAITDAAGQQVSVTADAVGRIAGLRLPDGRTWSLAYDGAGDLVSITDAAGGVRSFTYDASHQMLTATDPAGVTYLVNEFDASGRVVRQVDGGANVRTFAYTDTPDSNGLRSVVYTDNANRVHTYRFDASYRIVSVTDPAGETQSFTYDSASQVTSYTNAGGRKTAYAYDAGGNVVTETAPDGVVTNYAYAGSHVRGLDEESGDGGRRVTTFDLTPTGLVTAITDAGGGLTVLDRNAGGDVTRVVSPGGAITTKAYDARGNLVSVTDPLGQVTSIDYDISNRPVSTTNPAGEVVRYEWDASDKLVAQTGPDGARASFAYDANSLLTSSTAPDGGVTSYTWDALFHQTSTTDPLGAVTSFTYDSEDNLTAVTGPTGAVTTFVVDGANRVTETVDPTGAVWASEYEGGLLTAQVDPLGGRTVYTHDKAARVVGVTDPTGATWGTGYDAAGRVVSTVDPLGVTTTYTYDALDQMVSSTDPAGTLTYAYDGDGHQTHVTNRLGQVTTSTFDAAGQLRTETDPAGGATTFGYDVVGNLVTVTDPVGGVNSYAYDAAGNLITETDPAGGTRTFGYDAAGRVSSEQDPLEATHTNTYDLAGNVLTTTDPLGAVTTHAYDGAGNLVSTTDAAGGVTVFARDEVGRITTVTDPTGQDWTSTYDLAGQLVVETDPEGHQTTYTYDGAGRQTGISDAAGGTWGSGYDLAGQLLATVDPVGAATTFTYDDAGRTTAVTDPAGEVASYAYDAESNLEAATDRRGHTTTYTYDGASRVNEMTGPTGGVESYSYDLAGNLLTTTDPLGAVTAYAYDTVGRRISVTDPMDGVRRTEYDLAGRAVTQINANGAATSSTYDSVGQVVAVTDPMGAATKHAYDLVGNRVSSTSPDGQVTTWAYDPAGRLTTVVEADTTGHPGVGTDPVWFLGDPAEFDTNLTTTYAYTPAGNLASTTNARGKTTTYTYDRVGRVSSEQDPTGATWSYTYDRAGRPVSSTDAVGQTTKHAYDARGDLIETSYQVGASASFTYDEERNLIAMVDATGATGWIYDGAGRVTSQIDGARNELTYAYDDAGQLITAGVGKSLISYSYDAAGRPVRQHTQWGTAEYTWDAAGRLNALARTTADGLGGVTSTFAYDDADHTLAIAHLTPQAPAVPSSASDDLGEAGTPETGSAALVQVDQPEAPALSCAKGGNSGPYMAGRQVPSTVACETTDHYLTSRNLPSIEPVAAQGEGIRFDYTFNTAGNLTAATRQIGIVSEATTPDGADTLQDPQPQVESRTYSYDRAGRLNASTSSTGVESSYSYDQVGNRTAWSTTDDPRTLAADSFESQTTYDDANRASTTTQARAGLRSQESYTYNANGSRVATTVTGDQVAGGELDSVSTYDGAGHLESVSTAGRQETYVYDGLGRRTQTVTSTDTFERATTSIWDGFAPVGQSIATGTGSGESADTSVFVRDIFGRSLLENATALEATASGEARWALLDGLGSSVATASGAVITDLASYSDFGVQGFATTGWASTGGFTGQVSDPVMGTVSFYSRTYEPGAGVWTSADSWRGTLGEPLSANRYAYTQGNPVTMIDAGGYFSMDPRQWITQGTKALGKIAQAITPKLKSTAATFVNAFAKVTASVKTIATRVLGQSMTNHLARAVSSAVSSVTKAISKVTSTGRGKKATVATASTTNQTSGRHTGLSPDEKEVPEHLLCMANPGRELTADEADRLGQIKYDRYNQRLPDCPDWGAILVPDGYHDVKPIWWLNMLTATVGIDDALACLQGQSWGCVMAGIGIIPIGKAAALAKAAKAAKGAKGAEKAVEATKAAQGLGEIGFRSDVSHIFRKAKGHLADDTVENRELIKSALDPANLRDTITLKDGTTLQKYFKDLPDGTQAWAEVRNGEISNGGLNVTSR